MLKETGGKYVTLYDEELLRKGRENREYLLELRSENLLLPFLMEAGIFKSNETPEGIHGGWESPLCELRGHFLGHWLSAAAMHYDATKDEMVRAKADQIVAELAKCQEENGNGWCASIPEKYLDRLARGLEVWAPQYTIHKTFMGLLDMYLLTGNEQALEVADAFGDWFYQWSGKFTEDEFQKILSVETGGMLEIWAILYDITKAGKYKELMDRYYRKELFDSLLENQDVLTNMHANTTVPEVLGAAECYRVTGDRKYLEIAKAYWKQAVTERGSYATGGQTCGEIWTPKKQLSARLGDKNQEHCTVYNMMRLAKFLFCVTGNMEYMDYWEKNLYNGICAQGYWKGSFTHGYKSMYPTDGLISYFLPLRGGSQKPWSSRTQDFFCCHGSLVQANAAHNKGIYYLDDQTVYICQFFSSELNTELEGNKVKIKQIIDPCNGSDIGAFDHLGTQKINGRNAVQKSTPEKMVIYLYPETEKETELVIRIPDWAENVVVTVNGRRVKENSRKITLKQIWKNEQIQIQFEKHISTVTLPGQENMVAFMDGPVLLAGLCEEERILTLEKGKKAKDLLVPDNEREWGNWMHTFKTVGQERGIRFVPLNKIGYERYSVYFGIK